MAKSAVEGADLVVYVFDSPEKVSNKTDGIVVLNKTDNHKSKVKGAYCVSAITGEGIEIFRKLLEKQLEMILTVILCLKGYIGVCQVLRLCLKILGLRQIIMNKHHKT